MRDIRTRRRAQKNWNKVLELYSWINICISTSFLIVKKNTLFVSVLPAEEICHVHLGSQRLGSEYQKRK